MGFCQILFPIFLIYLEWNRWFDKHERDEGCDVIAVSCWIKFGFFYSGK